MLSKMKSVCEYEAPYPEIRVERKNPHYARMLSLAYAGPEGELAAILSYTYGGKVCAGKTPETLAQMLRCIANVEMRHMDMLGELITKLGGDPRFATGPAGRMGINTAMLNYQTDTSAVLRNAIASEEGAVRLYNDLIRAIDDRYIRELLKRIIKDEEHHIKLFREMLR